MQRSWRLSVLMLLAATVAFACDTPVYRYAMYQWAPAPYAVYLLHDQPLDDLRQAAASQMRTAAEDPTNPANLALRVVDLSADDSAASLPGPVRQELQRQSTSLPAYAMFSPNGQLIYAGAMAETNVAELLDSPARRTIAERLEEGVGCVLVLLTGLDDASAGTETDDASQLPDGADTATAQEQVRRLVEDVNSGKLELHPAPAKNLFAARQVPADEQPAGEASEPVARHQITSVQISRDDPAEQWLVRALLALESDLPELREPMVFPVYGRGRALPPYVGRGIRWDNLLEAVEYVTGACSCTVKEENPGMDLLIRHDWQTAAEKLAERFGAEEGNELQLASDELFPQLVIPTANPEALLADADTMPISDASIEPLDSEPTFEPSHPAADETHPTGAQSTHGVSSPVATPAGARVAQVGAVSWALIGGVLVGLVVLAVVTVLVVPRG